MRAELRVDFELSNIFEGLGGEKAMGMRQV